MCSLFCSITSESKRNKNKIKVCNALYSSWGVAVFDYKLPAEKHFRHLGIVSAHSDSSCSIRPPRGLGALLQGVQMKKRPYRGLMEKQNPNRVLEYCETETTILSLSPPHPFPLSPPPHSLTLPPSFPPKYFNIWKSIINGYQNIRRFCFYLSMIIK